MQIAKQCKEGTLHLIAIPEKYKKEIGKTAEKAFDEAGKLFGYEKQVEV